MKRHRTLKTQDFLLLLRPLLCHAHSLDPCVWLFLLPLQTHALRRKSVFAQILRLVLGDDTLR